MGTEPTLFPCPQCGTSRGAAESICPSCGWHPKPHSAPAIPLKSKTMGRFEALVLGCLTIAPLIYFALFFLTMFAAVAGINLLSGDSFRFLFICHFVVMMLIWILIAYYLVYLFRTDFVKSDQKALWAVVLFLGNCIAMPIFWYLYIWKPATRFD
jgi:hypothetical protein